MSETPVLRRRQAFVGMCDQVVSSGSNFLLLLLVAQGSSVGEFGWFAVTFGIVTVAMGLSRTALGVPLITSLGLAQRDIRHLVRQSIALAACAGLATSVVTLALALSLDGDPSIWAFLITIALPALVVQDLLRYVAVNQGRPETALIADGAWLLAIFAPWCLNVVDPGRVSGTWGVGGWIAGGVLALALLVASRVAVTPSFRGTGALLREPRRTHLAMDALLAAGAPALLSALIAVVAAPTVTGAWRGATTLMTPINILLAAVPLVFMRPVAELHERAALRASLKLGTAMCVIAVCWGLALRLVPDGIGELWMGVTWQDASRIAPVAAVETAGICLWTAGVTFLRARHRTAEALRWRITYAGAALVLGVSAGSLWANGMAVAGVLAGCAAVVATLLWRSLWRAKTWTVAGTTNDEEA